MEPFTVTIVAVRPARTGEKFVGINVMAGIAAVSTWLAEADSPGPVLIVQSKRAMSENPVIALRELAKAYGEATYGTSDLDEESFRKAEEYCDQPVAPPTDYTGV